MKYVLLKSILFLIFVTCKSEHISASNWWTKQFILYKLCILTTNQIKFTSVQAIIMRELKTKYATTNSSDFHPMQMVLPLTSLNEIKLQEEHTRIKKSTHKSNKKLNAHELRHKLKQLLTNISNTFSDMDWYFSLEQLENEAFDGGGHIAAKTKSKSNKKIHTDDDQSSDLFLDLFIRQMYEMNPLFIDKIRSRIDSEISSNKRRIRLAPPTNELDIGDSLKSNEKVGPARKSSVQDVQIRGNAAPCNDLYDDDKITEANSNDNPHLEELNANYYKGEQVYNIDEGDISESTILFTTTVSTNPPEAFYDYGDYSKEYYDDDYNNEQTKDIEEYEINQDIVDGVDSSTAGSKSGPIPFLDKEIHRRHAYTESTKNGTSKIRRKFFRKKKHTS